MICFETADEDIERVKCEHKNGRPLYHRSKKNVSSIVD